MSTRLSKASVTTIAKRLNESVRFRGEYNRLLSSLIEADAKVSEAQARLNSAKHALAKFFGVSTKASLYELEAAAKGGAAARKGR